MNITTKYLEIRTEDALLKFQLNLKSIKRIKRLLEVEEEALKEEGEKQNDTKTK